MRRTRLRHVQADRVARDPRQRHGAPGGFRSRRLRPGQVHRLRVRPRHGARRDAEVRRRRYPPVLRKRSAVPRAVPDMRVLVSWLRDFVDVAASPEEIAKTMSVRGFAVEGLEYIGTDLSAADAVIDFEVTGNRPD